FLNFLVNGGEFGITSGRVLVNNDEPPQCFQRLRFYVPQGEGDHLHPSRTVFESIQYSMLTHTGEATQRAVEEIAQKLQITDILHRRIGEKGQGLSGGQPKRVQIASALASGAPVLILDEPTSSLDDSTKEIVMNCLY